MVRVGQGGRSVWWGMCLAVWLTTCGGSARAEEPAPVADALRRAGDNRAELETALAKIPADQKAGLEFLIANMPERDLRGLKAEFLIENCDLAYRAWRQAPWKERIPVDVFHDAVLPYANINERRDAWRKEFWERFRPFIAEAKSPAEAAAKLNQKVFADVKVKYSTGRPKADQSPYESMQAGLASCSGLAVLLVDACRAVGVPARFVGTPLWSDKSGNHSWVEVWDNGWHFTGAAEPSGDQLDQAWFIERASTARRDHPLHAIYAVSFRRTPLRFPLVWDRSIDYVHAVNVTDRYTGRSAPPAADERRAMFKVVDTKSGQRLAARLTVVDANGKEVFQGETKDERFDANDHLTVTLKAQSSYEARVEVGGARATAKISTNDETPLVTIQLAPAAATPAPAPATPSAASAPASATLDALRKYLA